MTEIFTPPAPLKTAVLFLVFNRPDTTAQVFEAIRQAKPPRLYVAADGPREGREGEAERVAKVREIVTAVDWPCEVKTLFRELNLGCKYAVSNAISWFFEQEAQGVILEDDTLPSQSFFWFCEELLDRYKDEERIMSITGTNITKGVLIDESYFFSNYALMWGWATWARAWVKYDLELRSWSRRQQSTIFRGAGVKSLPAQNRWKEILKKTHQNEIDTWDYQWIYSCWINRGLTVAPAKNLVRNLGFSEEATHTKGSNPILGNLVLDEMQWPLYGPTSYVPHMKADAFISRHWFRADWKSFMKSILLKVPGVTLAYQYRKTYLENIC